MDISKSISYRGLELNGATILPGRTLRGIAIEAADYSNVDVVGYTEKRAGSDGVHASDVYLGGRTVQLSGHIYATSLAEMFDFLHVLRSVFSPTSAYQDDPGARGFLPIHFQQSTLDIDSYPAIVGPPAVEAGVKFEQVQDVLVTVAPIIGAPRVLAAAQNITDALGIVIAINTADAESESTASPAASDA